MDRYLKFLEEHIDENRIKHSVATAKQAAALAKIYGADENKAYIAGLLHDVAKGKCSYGLKKFATEYGIEIDEYEQTNPELIHGKLGAKMVSKELGILDEDILNAICWHTTGRGGMSLLEKIVYIADLTEPGRDFEDIGTIRELALKDIDAAMIFSLDCVMSFVKRKGFALHPNSIEAHKYLSKEGKKKLGLQ